VRSSAVESRFHREEAAAWLRTAGLLPAEAGLTNSEHACFKSCSAAHCGQAFYDESGSAAARHCSAHASSL
jgi:hypothetical protein